MPEKDLPESVRDTLCETEKSALIIPNAEIKEIFTTMVITWFSDNTRKWNCQKLFEAVWQDNSETALQQIDEKMYAKEFEDNYDEILCYGISFFKKRCLVRG